LSKDVAAFALQDVVASRCFSLRAGEAVFAPAVGQTACWRLERDGDPIFVRSR
jgi:hypothetical protein